MNLYVLHHPSDHDAVATVKIVANLVGFKITRTLTDADATLVVVSDALHTLQAEIEQVRAAQDQLLWVLDSGEDWHGEGSDWILDLRRVPHGGPYEVILTDAVDRLFYDVAPSGEPRESRENLSARPFLSDISPWLKALDED